VYGIKIGVRKSTRKPFGFYRNIFSVVVLANLIQNEDTYDDVLVGSVTSQLVIHSTLDTLALKFNSYVHYLQQV
jgi:hypothetical protein